MIGVPANIGILSLIHYNLFWDLADIKNVLMPKRNVILTFMNELD